MKQFLLLTLLLLLVSYPALSKVSLKHGDSLALKKILIAEAEHYGLGKVEINNNQSFLIVSNGRVLGTLIQGKGWLRETQPVCFIGWSKDNKKIDSFIPTVGQGVWEPVGCPTIDSVGLISKKDDDYAKIAVIYTIELSGRYGNDYYILSINDLNGRLFYDEETTGKFQNSYLKTIQDLRKAYQH